MLQSSKENPLPRDPGSGFGNRLCALLACFCQRREHDRQPATSVVVMPIRMMAVTVVAKHRLGLIHEPARGCQILAADER